MCLWALCCEQESNGVVLSSVGGFNKLAGVEKCSCVNGNVRYLRLALLLGLLARRVYGLRPHGPFSEPLSAESPLTLHLELL